MQYLKIQDCCEIVTICVLSQNCEIVTRLLQDCCKIVKKSSHVLCPNLRKIVARLLQDCYETDARLLRDCGKIVEKIHMCYVYSKGHFTGCTHNLTQPHLTLPNQTKPNLTNPTKPILTQPNSCEIYLALCRSGGTGGREPTQSDRF